MSLLERDGHGDWRTVVTAATLLQPETAGSASAFRVAWCGDRAAIIRGELHRFDMLPMTSAAPADQLIERDAKGWSAALPHCSAAKLNAPVYRFGASGWTVTVGRQEYGLDPEVQEEFVFGAPTAVDLNHDDVPDALLRYEERLGSGRQAFVAAMLGCGDGSYALIGSAPLGRAGVQVSINGFAGSSQALRISSAGGTKLYALDPVTRALVESGTSKSSSAHELRRAPVKPPSPPPAE